MKQRETARIILLNSLNQIFLFKAKLRGKFVWFTPGGGQERDETIEECAKRELFEETGLLADSPQIHFGPLVMKGEHEVTWCGWEEGISEGETVHLIESFFYCRMDDGCQFHIDANGNGCNWTENEREVIKEFRFWSLDDLKGTCETVYPPKLAQYLEALIQGDLKFKTIDLR